MSDYGQEIRRGPFGGDNFTQLHNYVFRDPMLHGLDMGVLGHISTHRDRWGLTARKIAEQMHDGEYAIKKALGRLEAASYIVRGQDTNDDGTFGRSWLFATDLPAQLKAAGVTDGDAVRHAVEAALETWLKENRTS